MAIVMRAEALITGKDQLTPIFDKIEKRAERLTKQLAALNRVAGGGRPGGAFVVGGRSTDSAISRLERSNLALARNLEKFERSVARLGRTPAFGGGGGHGVSHGLGLGFGGGMGFMAFEAAREGLHAAVKASADRAHESARMSLSGMTPAEVREATLASARLSAMTPLVSQTETMHTLRNARSIVGDLGEDEHIMEPLMKLRVIAQAARPGADVSEDFDKLIKGLEIKGVTQNPKQFMEYMNDIAKGLEVFGDTLKPSQFYEMFKYGRQGNYNLDKSDARRRLALIGATDDCQPSRPPLHRRDRRSRSA